MLQVCLWRPAFWASPVFLEFPRYPVLHKLHNRDYLFPVIITIPLCLERRVSSLSKGATSTPLPYTHTCCFASQSSLSPAGDDAVLLMTMMTTAMADACQQIPSPQPSYNSWALARLSLNEPDEADHFYPHLTDGKPRQRKLESFAPDDGHNCVKSRIQSRRLLQISSTERLLPPPFG